MIREMEGNMITISLCKEVLTNDARFNLGNVYIPDDWELVDVYVKARE